MYKAGDAGSGIVYMDIRLASRKKVYEWDGTKMGPAEDVTGFEQGGAIVVTIISFTIMNK